jgi:hypothetical protein
LAATWIIVLVAIATPLSFLFAGPKRCKKQTLASSDQNQSASKTPQPNNEELERNLLHSLEVMSSRERGGETKGCETEGDPKFRKSPPHKPKYISKKF